MGKVYNLARMTTATTGTGTVTLGSAVTGFVSFADAGVSNGESITYAIQDGANSEIGTGVYTAAGSTLTRVTILKSTNGGSAINLGGTAQVFITPSAEDFYRLPNTLGTFGVRLAAGTNVTADRTLTLTTGDASRTLQLLADLAVTASGDVSPVASINSGPLGGDRNRLVNGAMRINQRLSASNADDTYAHDRWYILTQTGAVAVTTHTLIDAGWPYSMRITQSQASAQRFGLAQIIESVNCYDLRGQSVSLSARVAISVPTTLRFAILEWTGSADAVTSDVVLDWTSGTYTAGNFFLASNFTVTATGSLAISANTATTVSLSATLAGSLNNIIVVFWTNSAQAQNVVLDIGKIQFENSTVPTAFEARQKAAELALCQRYYWKSFPQDTAPAQAVGSAGAIGLTAPYAGGNGKAIYYDVQLPTDMFATPTLTTYNPVNANAEAYDLSAAADSGSTGAGAFLGSPRHVLIYTTPGGGTAAGDLLAVHMTAVAEL